MFFHIITAQSSCANNNLFLGVYKGFEASQTPPYSQSQTGGGAYSLRYNEEKKFEKKEGEQEKNETQIHKGLIILLSLKDNLKYLVIQ